MTPQPAQVLLLPYLWIRARITVGPYEIISRQAFADDDFASTGLRPDVEGLLKMYEMRGSMASRFGCAIRRLDGTIGDPVDRAAMRPLRRAIVAALLDRIPEVGGDTQGWQVPTSDNAILYGHQLDGSGGVAVEYGRMVKLLVGGLKIGEEHSQIHPPAELHAPFLGPDPDAVYLSALYTEITKGTAASRRLGRAIDWLDLAWRNTDSIDDDTRIVAIFSAFEVLLEQGGVDDIGTALSSLLAPGSATTRRSIPNRRGNPIPRDLTDLEWWFTSFGFLRNDIAHGNEIDPTKYEWDGRPQLFLGEHRLRQAIRQTVANNNHPEVLLDPFERIVRKYAAVIIDESDPEGRTDEQ